ncbi:hypothetical protein HOY80DRAFT_999670 [Tuber brumale]|nr:hypothetical protein HOY80DRAFT_999670 [Tuber brumale]
MTPNTAINTWNKSGSPPPISSPLRTSPIVTPDSLQKSVAQSPSKPKKRHNGSASNSEVLAKRCRVAGGSVVKDTAIPDANITGGAVDIEDLIVKICQGIENVGSAADQAHLGTLRSLQLAPPGHPISLFCKGYADGMSRDLVREMRQHAEIWMAKLEQLSKDFDETNSNLAQCCGWRERDPIVSGEIASKSGDEETIQFQSTPSAKRFHDAEEYETGEGQAKRWGQQ